jgi:hypothetical protein
MEFFSQQPHGDLSNGMETHGHTAHLASLTFILPTVLTWLLPDIETAEWIA